MELTRKYVNENLLYDEIYFELLTSSEKIKKLQKGLFQSFDSIKKIDLRDNLIDEIDQNTFATLDSLTHLNLSKNYLSVIEKNVFSSLKSLKYNPFSYLK